MKLASLRNGRDGRLVVVKSNLSTCVSAESVAPTLQSALDHWAESSLRLRALAAKLESGIADNIMPFDETACASPLPRAYQIADGSAYLNHVELVRKARGATMPPEFLTSPLMYQAVSGTTLDPHGFIPVSSESYGIDFEGEVAVITDDVPMGVSAQDALGHVCLVMLMNDVSLRNLIPDELAKGFGFFQSKPPSGFSPVAVTPDELDTHWRDGKLHLPLLVSLNGKSVGRPNAGTDMQFDFGTLIAHAAHTRPLSAGTIVGSGTVSNRDPGAGISCLAETRMIETIKSGVPSTPFMRFGDRVRIEMQTPDGCSIFGAIEQDVRPA